jgi:hypothetical protein
VQDPVFTVPVAQSAGKPDRAVVSRPSEGEVAVPVGLEPAAADGYGGWSKYIV